MPENKNQHYVPGFYLKRFSPDDEKKLIGIWNVSRERKLVGASLKDQCSRDYFYGKDLILEKTFGNLETLTAKLLRNTDETYTLPPQCSEEHCLLLMHLATQWTRTKYMRDAMDEMSDKFMANLHRIDEQEGERYQDEFDLHVGNPVHLSIQIAAETFPLILDLDYKILVNRTECEFVTSDNPVVFYNQLFSFDESKSNTGLTVKGLQIFFPIDPEKALLFYDAGVYSVGRRNQQIVDVLNPQDVDQVNTLQMSNCQNNVYFRDTSFDYEPLHRRACQFRRRSMTRLDVFQSKDTESRSEELVAMSLSDVKTNLSLSFVQITKGAKAWKQRFLRLKSRPALVVRNQFLCDEYRKNESKLHNRKVDPAWLFQHLCTKCLETNCSTSALGN